MNKKVYIAGPMRGKANNNFEAFKNAELYLKALGYEPINPFDITDGLDDLSDENCMKKDIAELINCFGVYMLDDWVNSENASLEFKIAKTIGLKRIW